MLFGRKDKPKEEAKDPPRQIANPVSTTAARAHLECTAGPEKGQPFRCAPAVTVVGRDASCDVVLTEAVISRQHLRIERRPDGWILKNLSSNGTLVNRKPADEVVLADGDEIRLGAKTRLKFVVEAVATLTTGRPQFRPRAVGQEDEEDKEKEPQAAEGAQPSVFKRRKGLFIALGVYLGIVVVIAAVLAFRNPTAATGDEIPVLGLEDMIIPEPGAAPLRVLRQEPEGYYCEDSLGQHRLVPFEALKSGKAVFLLGIRKAMDVRFEPKKTAPARYPYVIEEKNEALADLYKKQATENYLLSKLPGKEPYLFAAVRTYQKALAYYGSRASFVDDSATERSRLEATRDLIDKVKNTYDTAISYEKSGDPRKAWKNYELLMKLVPELGNPVRENVSKRMNALKAKHKDIKF